MHSLESFTVASLLLCCTRDFRISHEYIFYGNHELRCIH